MSAVNGQLNSHGVQLSMDEYIAITDDYHCGVKEVVSHELDSCNRIILGSVRVELKYPQRWVDEMRAALEDEQNCRSLTEISEEMKMDESDAGLEILSAYITNDRIVASIEEVES